MPRIKWNHIMDSQPDHERSIIHCDPPYQGHYSIGMRDYYQSCSFEEILKYNEKHGWPNPDFWWVYSEDFPFPDIKIQEQGSL